jgi:hypothetical protein
MVAGNRLVGQTFSAAPEPRGNGTPPLTGAEAGQFGGAGSRAGEPMEAGPPACRKAQAASTPFCFAAWVAIASMSGGDRQS